MENTDAAGGAFFVFDVSPHAFVAFLRENVVEVVMMSFLHGLLDKSLLVFEVIPSRGVLGRLKSALVNGRILSFFNAYSLNKLIRIPFLSSNQKTCPYRLDPFSYRVLPRPGGND